MDVQELIKEILSPKHKAVYVVSSEELFFIDKLVQTTLDQYLEKDFQEFNQSVLYGKDTNARAIMDQAREFPFFGEKKLIIVKDAQDVKEWDGLTNYAKQPNASTLLIICFSKKPDGRSSWVKQIKDLGFLIEFKSLSDYQLPAFIKSAIKELKIEMDEESQMLLMDSIGNDLATIYNELEKLKLNIGKGQKVGKDEISRFIGISKEYNVFELQKAISYKDHKRIYWIAQNMGQHSKANPIIATIGALFNHFQRIWFAKVYDKMNDDELSKLLKLPFKSFIKEYREAAGKYSLPGIERAINLLKEYDLKSKGMYLRNATEQELYLELSLKINQL
jgi:DNA polymerase-3 subunit delta